MENWADRTRIPLLLPLSRSYVFINISQLVCVCLLCRNYSQFGGRVAREPRVRF